MSTEVNLRLAGPETTVGTGTSLPGGGKWWGDTVGSFDGTEWSPPQGVCNIDDPVGAIKTWPGAHGAPEIPRTDVEPQEPSRVVNLTGAFVQFLGFQGFEYPGPQIELCADP